jgi:hypothetical protein
MRRLLLTSAVCLLCHGAFADMLGPPPAILNRAVVPSVVVPSGPLIAAAQVSNDTDTTTASINTTGATILVCNLSQFRGLSNPNSATVTDNKGNAFAPLTFQVGNIEPYSRLFYVANPAVGAGHTFTSVGSGALTLTCAGFNGVRTSSPLDVQQGFGDASPATSCSSHTASPMVTTVNGELIVAGNSNNASTATPALIGGSYATVVTPSLWNSGHWEAGGLAYWVQSTAGSTDATWTYGASADCATVIAGFKP